MNQFAAILLLSAGQFLAGYGFLRLFDVNLRKGYRIPLSFLCGITAFSIIPFLMELLTIPITRLTVAASLILTVLLFNFKLRKRYREISGMIRTIRFRFRLYEAPFILITILVVLISAWRCYYLPPTPRDLTSGPEVIAEYAVREHSLINSVFEVNLETTNNQFKPPFITTLQVIYKMAGFPFGQVWLTTVFIAFLVFLYHALRERMHRLLAWALLVFFLAIPEMFAYTFMVLFDYSNAVFFFLSVFFLLEYFRYEKMGALLLSGWMMGVATYIRSETLLLAFLILPGLLWHHIKKWDGLRTMSKRSFSFLYPSVIFYVLTVTIYIHYYLPLDYDVQGLINPDLLDIRPFFERFADMNMELIFSATGINYYGWFVLIFLLVSIVDAVLTDQWTRETKNWLYAVLVIWIGLPLIGYLFPLMDLHNSTKRALFKIFPLMLLYMGHSGVLMELSKRLQRWEDK